MYAPPWVRGAQHRHETQQRPDETAAVERRLKHEPRWLLSQTAVSLQPDANGRSSSTYDAGNTSFDIEDALRELRPLSELEPTLMPPPPKPRVSLASLGTISRFVALGLAAGATWAVTSAVRTSSPDKSFGSTSATMQSRPVGSPGTPNKATAVRAETSQGQMPAEHAPSRLAPSWNDVANATAAPKEMSPTSLATATASGRQSSQPPQALTATSRTHERDKLARDEISSLLKRGQDLIASGDLGGARLILSRVADAGDANASFMLAGTFDPEVLARLNVVGARPDPVLARKWYAKAAEQGSPEAGRRLNQLGGR
jgi:hypothetical protein